MDPGPWIPLPHCQLPTITAATKIEPGVRLRPRAVLCDAFGVVRIFPAGVIPTPYFFLKSPTVTTVNRDGSMYLRRAAFTASGVSSAIFRSRSARNSIVRPR